MEDFVRWERLTVKQMLLLDSFACSELDIFDACLEWAKVQCQLNGITRKT